MSHDFQVREKCNYYFLEGLMMASFRFYTNAEGEEITVIPILECGEVLSSFSVVTVKMRRVKYQCNVSDEAMGTKTVKVVVDGFMKDDPSLDRSYPAEVAIMSNSKNACLVEVSIL